MTVATMPGGATTIDAIAAALQQAYADGHVLISATTTGAAEVSDLLAAAGLTELSVATSVRPTADAGRLVVSGTSTALGPEASANVIFEVIDDVLIASLDMELPGQSLELTNLSWATVTDLGIDVRVVGSPGLVPVVDYLLRGAVRVAGTPDPIEVTVGASPRGGWELRASDIPLPDPVALLTALLDQQSGTLLPPSLTSSSSSDPTATTSPALTIRSITCDVNPDDLSVRALAVTIGTHPDDRWTLASGLPALRDISFALALNFPTDDEESWNDSEADGPDLTVSGAATITFDVHQNPLELPVRVSRSPEEWRVGITNAHNFPSLGALLGEVLGSAAEAQLPAAVTSLALQSATLDVAIGTQDSALRSILVSARLGDRWILLDGDRLVLEHLAVDVFHDAMAGATTGFLTATVDIDSVRIPLAIRKPTPSDPLTISLGTSEPPTLNGMSALSGVMQNPDPAQHLPQGFGGGPLGVRDLTLQLDAQSFEPSLLHVDVRSAGPWSLTELPGVDVRDIAVDLTVTMATSATPAAQAQASGSLRFVVHVGDASVQFAAERVAAPPTTPQQDGLWRFKGDLNNGPLHLDALLAVFASGTDTPARPAALSGVTITTASFTFDTGGDVSVTCSGQLPVEDTVLAVSLLLTARKGTGGAYTIEFAGHVIVAEQEFTLALSRNVEESRLLAAYAPVGGQTLGAASVLKAISPSLALDLFPDPEHHDLSVHVASALLALAVDAGSTRALVALDVGRIELSGLPLVGDSLEAEATIESLRVIAATGVPMPPAATGTGSGGVVPSTTGDPGDIAGWNALLQLLPGLAAPGPLPVDGVASGVLISAVVKTGTTQTPLALPVAGTARGTASPAAPAPGAQVAIPAPSDGTKWVQVERSLGPVYLARVGARYDSGFLWFVLDASMALGGLSVELTGLAVGSELSEFDLDFRLQGMGLDYRQDPVAIAGAFLRVAEDDTGVNVRYDGAALVHAESFTLGAVGSYAQVHGSPSLFIFAELDAVIGGPPAFFVTGISGGFGYNRALRIPEQDEVATFPFVRGLLNGAGTGGLMGTLEQLDKGSDQHPAWLSESIGESWLAAGVTFTSFSAMETHALLIAEFGNELQFALLGLSTLRLPRDSAETFAYLELEIEARLKPSEGSFSLTALLTQNSYVFDPTCRLTGGFALCIWFGGDRAGDFVLTLGGYHPAYSPPAWYPQEPRLALHWPVSDLVTIDGNAYFALTPSCVMAGGFLQVLFHDGNLRAWLTAQADFLMGWAPFHFTGDVGVSVGVSYVLDGGFIQKTLSVELGAHLSLWGPPTAGRAHVSFYIASFDVSFGQDPGPPAEAPTWAANFKPLLPESPCGVHVLAGRVAEPSVDEGSAENKPWRVRPDSLVFSTTSAIPCGTAVQVTEQARDGVKVAEASRAPAIRPLGLATVESTHKVTVRDANHAAIDLTAAGWSFAPQTRSMPSALWGEPVAADARPAGGRDLVPDQLVGVVLTSPPPHRGPSTGPHPVAPAPDPAATGALPAVGLLASAGQAATASDVSEKLAVDRSSARNDLAAHLTELGFDLAAIDLHQGPATGTGPAPVVLLLADAR